MKSSTFFLPSAAILLAAAIIASAQTPAIPAPPATEARVYPAPTNLKVLPKDLTGQQLHEIMEQWAAALGTHCNSCHVQDPSHIRPNGRPDLNYADDSKEMKQTARIMFKMTEDINLNYVSMIDNSGAPVTCGTCHRGHIGPEPFIPLLAKGQPSTQPQPSPAQPKP